MGKKGRPPKFVLDESGRPIVGLSLDKNNGSYYATYSKPRQYFGSDYARAVFEYYRYSNQQKHEQPYVEMDIPFAPITKTNSFVDWAEVDTTPVVPKIYKLLARAESSQHKSQSSHRGWLCLFIRLE